MKRAVLSGPARARSTGRYRGHAVAPPGIASHPALRLASFPRSSGALVFTLVRFQKTSPWDVPGVSAPMTFDRERLLRAFEYLGTDLASRGVFLELAVYGGSAIMLRYAWRRGTEDVDAVLRPGYDERDLAPSVSRVAEIMDLSADWLNDAVGMFTPLEEAETLFEVSGNFPALGMPGLRVLVATPHYLLALKLLALSSLDRGDRDLNDARSLAREMGITDVEALRRLYTSIHGAGPTDDLLRQFASVLG